MNTLNPVLFAYRKVWRCPVCRWINISRDEVCRACEVVKGLKEAIKNNNSEKGSKTSR